MRGINNKKTAFGPMFTLIFLVLALGRLLDFFFKYEDF